MHRTDFSDKIKKDIERGFYDDREKWKSLNDRIWGCAFDALQIYGSFSITFDKNEIDKNEPCDGLIRFSEDRFGEDVILDQSYAETCLHELKTDEGLRVTPTRNEYGILERITVTLNYDED